MYDAVIVGGGVIGCAVARYLSRYQLNLCLLERGEDVCIGTSKANSAIVHAGFDAAAGSKKAYFNVRGSAMMEALSRELDFSYQRNGALVLCFDEGDLPHLRELHQRGKKNGVTGLEILWADALYQKEPALAPGIYAALYAPTSAIVCPFGLTIALAENARQNGCEFRFNSAVERVERRGDHFLLRTAQGDIESRVVINAAGLYGDVLHNQLCENKIEITPRRGEYCLLDRRDGGLVKRTIFQLPGALGKGILVSPTVHGNLLIGPTAADQSDRDDTATTAEGLDFAVKTALRSVANLPMRDVITSFSGLRSHLTVGGDDFIVGESADGFFEAVGIESPGLTSAPAIGEYLADAVAEKLNLAKNESFLPTRKDIPHLRQMDFAQRQKLVAENPAYGNIICRCEEISEGEIVEAIRRGARSLDGVKRRVRAGMGRCQGGFCSPKVLSLLSRELGVDETELTKSGGNSPVVLGKTKEVAE